MMMETSTRFSMLQKYLFRDTRLWNTSLHTPQHTETRRQREKKRRRDGYREAERQIRRERERPIQKDRETEG